MIHYLVEGEGEAVVLIHGLYSSARINWQLPGLLALRLIAEHPDRVPSATLGGMGRLAQGSGLQRVWEHIRDVAARGVRELALTRDWLQAIHIEVLARPRIAAFRCRGFPLLFDC